MVRAKMPFLQPNHSNHVLNHAVSVAVAVITQVISDIFFVLGKDSSVPNALFQTSFREVSETFPLEVTMDWWSENYCIIIDLWSKAWLLDAVVNLCRRNVFGPVSCNPELHPPVFYQLWATVNIARMYSMYLWSRQFILGAVLLQWIPPVFSFCMLYMSYSNLSKHKAWLAINSPSMISRIRYLTQNGLALFAWWSLLNALVGLGVVLKHKAGVPDPLVSTIVLTIVSLCIITWFVLQTFLLTKYMCHTFTVYAVVVMSLGSMFTRSYHIRDLAANTVYCGFIMLMTTIMSLIHLVTVCLCTDESSKPLVMEPLKFDDCVTVCQLEGSVKNNQLYNRHQI
ncbi:uncharacterized protein LOC124995787 [Mugil cephalus]|uniref:uncharacterized protein LOC124995787 n=1 Tax=Mugil cephalus TaxID=48193 RepID=UPI001FB5E6FD|nr:uncharacterized protein LOC124995787 [Mugil cephalus]